MRCFDIAETLEHRVQAHGSVGFDVRQFVLGDATSVTFAHLEAGGIIGRHRATRPQLLMPVSGTVETAGEDGRFVTLAPGSFALFEQGELHETKSRTGATLCIVEGDFRLRRQRRDVVADKL